MARRLFITALVLLTIGAALNVLVAWVCVVATESRVFNARTLGQLRAAEFERADREHIEARYLAMLFESIGTRVLMLDEADVGSLTQQRISQHDAGWPFLALRAEQSRGPRGAFEIRTGVKAGTLSTEYPALPVMSVAPPSAQGAPPVIPNANMLAMPRTQQRLDRILPLRPIWPGFAVNSIVLGLLAWLAWLLFTLLVRLQRRWRGRCGRCAYPIGVSPVCTECGCAVAPHQPTWSAR